ncbi:MAG: endonuclease/exonuclease/phosphatase family protein [Pseudohongiellaceae bacterium]
MKLQSLVFTLLILVSAASSQASESSSNHPASVNVMSFNIRYNNPNDGEHAWPNRKAHVASVIEFHQAGLVGLQEVLRGQLDELAELLPDYAWVGVGRNDGQNAGEFAPIFYRTDRFELLDSGVFWLSETPNTIASKGWDAALPRIATWARFKDVSNDRDFLHLNTHFDHRGELARVRSSELIISQLESLGANLPVVVTGDFNVPPTSEAYQTMTSALNDSKMISDSMPHGPEGTFGGFTAELDEANERIDYVFVGSDTKVLRYGVLSDHWNGRYPSDHQPVLVEVQWPE